MKRFVTVEAGTAFREPPAIPVSSNPANIPIGSSSPERNTGTPAPPVQRESPGDHGDIRGSTTWRERVFAALPLFLVGAICLVLAAVLYASPVPQGVVRIRPWFLFLALGLTGLGAATAVCVIDDEQTPEDLGPVIRPSTTIASTRISDPSAERVPVPAQGLSPKAVPDLWQPQVAGLSAISLSGEDLDLSSLDDFESEVNRSPDTPNPESREMGPSPIPPVKVEDDWTPDPVDLSGGTRVDDVLVALDEVEGSLQEPKGEGEPEIGPTRVRKSRGRKRRRSPSRPKMTVLTDPH